MGNEIHLQYVLSERNWRDISNFLLLSKTLLGKKTPPVGWHERFVETVLASFQHGLSMAQRYN